MKLIRESRMGPPKSFKTGAIVGTYPKPLLYLGFDRGGIDVIPSRKTLESLDPSLVRPNCAYEDITFLKPGLLGSVVESQSQPPVTAIQYYEGTPLELSLDIKPTGAQMPFQNFVTDYNRIANRTELPWKTIVLDGLTGLSTVIINWMAAFNPGLLVKAWDWVPVTVTKITQTCLSMTSLPCHVVVILHSYLDKNETTGEISEKPNLYGKEFRDEFFGMFSQCFYSLTDANGKPSLLVSSRYPVKGIGPRWPIGLPKEIPPDFNSIYSKELGAI